MKTLIRLITGFVLFSVPAFAQNSDITIFAGFQAPGKITLTNTVSTGSSAVTQIITDPKNAGEFGLRFGHGKVWGGEHTMAFTGDFLDSKSKAFIYNSNLRIQLPSPVVKPYATAGIGAIVTWGSGVSDLGTKFAFNYGGGVKIMPAGPVGINISVRGYSVQKVQSQTLNIAEGSVGIVFGF